jgi:hypothetical protein
MQEEQKRNQEADSPEWATDGTEVLESGPFDVESLRWTQGSGSATASRLEINQLVETYSPIYTRVFGQAFEVRPSPLYLALEELPLDGASDEALRAYVSLREQVVEDPKEAVWNDIDSVMRSD